VSLSPDEWARIRSSDAVGPFIATVPLLSRFSRVPEFASFVRGLK
jgi:hypothetical protein